MKKINEGPSKEYKSRINKVQDYIETHLSEEFSLHGLSSIANFSPYHFHRIYNGMTGETLFQYIQRVRLEKAAYLLLANKQLKIIQIALDCGFSTQASFAKAFKNHFNMSASQFRINKKSLDKSIVESNMGKVSNEIGLYNRIIRNEEEIKEVKNVTLDYQVTIKTITDMEAVYIRHTGPYKQDCALFERLFGQLYFWVKEKNLIHPINSKWLTLYHDTPEITPDDKLRISVCMTVEEKVDTDGEIGNIVVQGGRYAVGHFEISEDAYQDAWNAMYSEWFPQSRYQPDDRLCFELYQSQATGEEGKHLVDIYIPVRPL